MPDKLPPIPIWRTRSFWLGVVTVALYLSERLFGSTFGLAAGQVTDAIMVLLPVVTGVLAYRERMDPGHRVTVRKPRDGGA